ncbi:MAG: hypothetical protein QOC94_4408 [Actinoplanes sp.]|nr:hypothetical protein [Actinoplanes sp.]MDT5044044.1 hypothetical protein [Actinoplanes sp.]
MVLTYRRLVITNETRVLHRLRLHLNADLRHLSNVSWSPDLRGMSVDIAATAVDGIRERFRIKLLEPEQVWQVDSQLKHVFRERPTRPATVEIRRTTRAAA